MSKRGREARLEEAKIEQAKADTEDPKEATNKIEEAKEVAMPDSTKEGNNQESVTQQAGDTLQAANEQVQPVIETITDAQPELDQASAGVHEAIAPGQATDTAEA